MISAIIIRLDDMRKEAQTRVQKIIELRTETQRLLMEAKKTGHAEDAAGFEQILLDIKEVLIEARDLEARLKMALHDLLSILPNTPLDEVP